MSTERKRAVGYVRVSSRGQEERGAGLAAQRDRVKDYATASGLELVDVVSETASGAVREGELTSLEHRPILSDLLEQARRGEYAALVVPSFDRLSRDQLDAQLIKRWFAKYGVACLSAAGETNGAEGPLAELIDRLLGAIHEFERKQILQRLRGGVAKRKQQGRLVQGNVPFGYLLVKATDEAGGKTLEPIPSPAAVVERIYRDASRGLTPGRIAKTLTEAGAESPSGGAWNRTTVRKILESRAYRGELHGVKEAHPAIVTPQLWNAANRELRRRARRS